MNTDFPSCRSLEKATVIIPCYNVEAYIHECLDSVALQGDVVQHIYVVDNNSIDDTVDKVRRWQNGNPTSPLTLLSQTKPGAPAARNLPLSLVETKWIQFLDADDLLLPGKIDEQIREFPKADVICAGYQRVSLHGEKTPTLPSPNIPLALFQGAAGITSSNLFSTRSIQSVKGWDETLMSSQEYDLMFRIWQTGAAFDVNLTPQALIRERQTGQISQRDPKKKWQQVIELRLRMLETFRADKVLGQKELQEVYQSLYNHLLTLGRYDIEYANNIFLERLKPLGFEPKGEDLNGAIKKLLFRIFGFTGTIQSKLLFSLWGKTK